MTGTNRTACSSACSAYLARVGTLSTPSMVAQSTRIEYGCEPSALNPEPNAVAANGVSQRTLYGAEQVRRARRERQNVDPRSDVDRTRDSMTTSMAAIPGGKPRLTEGLKTAPQPTQCAANGLHLRRITAPTGGPATTCGVLGEITCEKAASIPTTLRWRSGPVAAAVWLWSLRWSSAHEPPVTADTPCCQPKQAWDQPKLRRKERRKLGMRTSVGRSSEPPSELRARSEPRLRQNQSRMQAGAGGKAAAAHFGDW
jgi:hypothetical protein